METTLTYPVTKMQDAFVVDWEDEMTDDTYAEMIRCRGEARDVDYNRNREFLARHFGLVAA